MLGGPGRWGLRPFMELHKDLVTLSPKKYVKSLHRPQLILGQIQHLLCNINVQNPLAKMISYFIQQEALKSPLPEATRRVKHYLQKDPREAAC